MKEMFSSVEEWLANQRAEEAQRATTSTCGQIKDSGARRQFATGAVRDIQHISKGRCDLLPLREVAECAEGWEPWQKEILFLLDAFQTTGVHERLREVLILFGKHRYPDASTMFLELAIHMAAGSEKYGENNWKLGINAKHYIDSGVRHYLKLLRGDKDEPHDRAFCFNIICAIWTCRHRPELHDYRTAAPWQNAGTLLEDRGDESSQKSD